jgi:hypothetical protein
MFRNSKPTQNCFGQKAMLLLLFRNSKQTAKIKKKRSKENRTFTCTDRHLFAQENQQSLMFITG